VATRPMLSRKKYQIQPLSLVDRHAIGHTGCPMKTLVLVFLFAAVSLKAQAVLPLDPASWTLSTNSSKSAKVYTCGSASLCFDFPAQKSKTVNYLYTVAPQSFGTAGNLSASIQVVTTGAPVFNYVFEPANTCVYPAHFRLYFEADSSAWTNSAGDTFRWWSNPIAYELAGGSATLTVPLTGDQWSTVYGRFGNSDADAAAGFQASLLHTGLAGGTFGGGCFFGHGVNVSGGTAQFQLLSYSIF